MKALSVLIALFYSAAASAGIGAHEKISPILLADIQPKGDRPFPILVVSSSRMETLAALGDLGMTVTASRGALIQATVTSQQVSEIIREPTVRKLYPVSATTWSGLTATEGLEAMRVDALINATGLSGDGVIVGLLSDSFNCDRREQTAIDDGDIPIVTVFKESPFCDTGLDEGRALAEIVHDIAPAAKMFFHTGFSGPVDFAQGIRDMADSGADVIVDDIGYFLMPFLQESFIDEAIEDVVSEGVIYVSSAGNSGNSGHMEEFDWVERVHPVSGHMSVINRFPSGDTGKRISVPVQSSFTMFFQWDDPSALNRPDQNPDGDVDLYLLDGQGQVVAQAGDFNMESGVPVEILQFFNGNGSGGGPGRDEYTLVLELSQGVPPSEYFWVLQNSSSDIDWAGSKERAPTIFGHANNPSAITVGAIAASRSPLVNSSVSPTPNAFSSFGGLPRLLDASGAPTRKIPLKPDVTAVDGVNTSFFGLDIDQDGFPNFSGTSASAPHIAGIVALLLEKDPSLSPTAVRAKLQQSALDLPPRGFDSQSGAGLVNASSLLDSETRRKSGSGPLSAYVLLVLVALAALRNRCSADQ